jgi:hypothetical protein
MRDQRFTMSRSIKTATRPMNPSQECSRHGGPLSASAIAPRTRINRTTRWAAAPLAAATAVLALAASPAGAQAAKPAGAPPPVATWIGARSIPWPTGNTAIGPLKTQRVFYPSALPARYSASQCASLPAGVMCVISYKTPGTNVASFVKSIPASRPVMMIFHHEPEGGDFASGAQFVSEFESQSDLIRSAAAAAGLTNVQVAMAAGTYQYQPGKAGTNCSYIPPAHYVDHYTADVYQPRLGGLQNRSGFVRWRACTQGLGRSRGVTEYGLGSCSGAASRQQTMAADAVYLRSAFPHLYLLEYWWVDDSNVGPCRNWKFTDQATISEWRSARGW